MKSKWVFICNSITEKPYHLLTHPNPRLGVVAAGSLFWHLSLSPPSSYASHSPPKISDLFHNFFSPLPSSFSCLCLPTPSPKSAILFFFFHWSLGCLTPPPFPIIFTDNLLHLLEILPKSGIMPSNFGHYLRFRLGLMVVACRIHIPHLVFHGSCALLR